MEQVELLVFAVNALQRIEAPYALVGSYASGAWGEARFTQDIDIVVELRSGTVDLLCSSFPSPDFYLSSAAAHEAVQRQTQFNVIHPASGNKIVFIIAHKSPWAIAQLNRCKSLSLLPDFQVNVAAPEDVILGKLLYYREGGSEKHIRDITGIIKVSGADIDQGYLVSSASQLGVLDLWQQIIERTASK